MLTSFFVSVTDIDLHPDDANFTGVIPDDTLPISGNELFSISNQRPPGVILPLGFKGEFPSHNLTSLNQLPDQIPFLPHPMGPNPQIGPYGEENVNHNQGTDPVSSDQEEYFASQETDGPLTPPPLPLGLDPFSPLGNVPISPYRG